MSSVECRCSAFIVPLALMSPLAVMFPVTSIPVALASSRVTLFVRKPIVPVAIKLSKLNEPTVACGIKLSLAVSLPADVIGLPLENKILCCAPG